MHLYFLRHGESTANHDGLVTGQLDVPLTEKGREQANAAGVSIKESGLRIDLIVSSPLDRALETAQIIAEHISYVKDAILTEESLTERYFGTLQGKTQTEVGVISDEMLFKAGAEPREDLMIRAETFLAWVKQQDAETVLVVSHNGIGKRIRGILVNSDPHQLSDAPNGELIDLGEV